MKVYVITSGEYSDYRIEAVSLNQEDAEKKCAILNDIFYENEDANRVCEINICDTDDLIVDTRNEVKVQFEMVVNVTRGNVIHFKNKCLSLKNINEIEADPYTRYISVIATLPKDTTDEQAKKIMLDRIAKFKAERAGVL